MAYGRCRFAQKKRSHKLFMRQVGSFLHFTQIILDLALAERGISALVFADWRLDILFQPMDVHQTTKCMMLKEGVRKISKLVPRERGHARDDSAQNQLRRRWSKAEVYPMVATVPSPYTLVKFLFFYSGFSLNFVNWRTSRVELSED